MTNTVKVIQRGEFDEKGNVRLHEIKVYTMEDGTVIPGAPHTTLIRPGDDLTKVPEGPAKQLCGIVHTPEAVAARREKDEETRKAREALFAESRKAKAAKQGEESAAVAP